MNIFNLAIQEVEREGKINQNNAFSLVIDRMITIRKYLDIKERNTKINFIRKLKKKK